MFIFVILLGLGLNIHVYLFSCIGMSWHPLSSSVTLYYVFRGWVSSLTDHTPVTSLTDQQVLGILHFPIELQMPQAHLAFYIGSGHPRSGPHACTTAACPTVTSPQLHN